MYSAGSSPTDLTRSFAWKLCKWPSAVDAGRRSSNSDQGCQFTSTDFVARLKAEDMKISWSGRKRCYDNIQVKRLWRTLNYEKVYPRAYSDGWEAEISLARFL